MTVHSESKNSISVRPSTKQLAISSSGSNSHAETPFSCMARYCEREMSVWIDSGGFAVMNAVLLLARAAHLREIRNDATHLWPSGTLFAAYHP